ncbi:hypothetical protein [Lysobacter enzymogenes]|uniref:hypothetical protein n=1 Tax=Lysobacter enzymogenes TaxID=69 RepID=UPI001A96AD92|nr:hypothetical protein [Lysobacter enzymogenes]QQP96471.1 hypothetical protein JHW38_25295 [Lysobacter enzymogenes]QQP96505.1 hypothetical protein JHW38_00145 [Lysobacter enzymogenes]
MATLPQSVTQSPTVTAIYSWWEGKLERLSRRLGASQIGRPCDRELWYSFRWCFTGNGPRFDGRMRRLFNRGHREEAVFTEELRGAGLQVIDLDPGTGEQFTFTACSGHFVAKIDGVALGVFEAPKTWHNLSYKTAKDDKWKALHKSGAKKAEPGYWAQNQVEMRLASLERTLLLSVNKNDDQIYGERIRHDETASQRLLDRADRVIFSPEPLTRLSEDPAWWQCKGRCSFYDTCHGVLLPKPSCRACLHATPERDGDGRWSCAKYGADIPLDAQREGCGEHRYIPALLSRWGEAVDASEAEGWVEYRAADGYVFRNGPWGINSFTSKELAASTPALLRDVEFQRIRAEYAGVIVDRESETFEEAA